MASRVVRQIDLTRVLDALEKRGIVPTAFDVMPGGTVRLHRVPPLPANDDTAVAEQEAAAWDEALK